MEFEHALNRLVGLPLSKIGRAADLFWIQFGALQEIQTRQRVSTIGEWAIHIQTSWRFVRDRQITLAVGDLYLLPNGENYDWDAGGDSNFDILARKLNDSFLSTPITVQCIRCDEVGGFSIAMSDGSRLDVFPKISHSIHGIENRRLFKPDDDGQHIICETGT